MQNTKPSVVKVITRQIEDGPYLSAKVTLSDGTLIEIAHVYVFENEKRQSKFPKLTAILREVAAKDRSRAISRNDNGSISYTGK